MALESSAEQPQPLRAVVSSLKAWVERTRPIWVEGQIIQLKRRAGHQVHFLTLRDRLADISVRVSITTVVLDAVGPLPEGALVSAHVRATVYAGNGSLTFECRELRLAGEGRLLAHIEQRKRMLQAEGLFNPAQKRPLPFLPRRIGLVTGQDSAAERDVIATVSRRWPRARWDIRHTLVQGAQAAEQVREAVLSLDQTEEVDVIIVARGGGSLEDLLPFSDESLARAVHACQTPVVSAIGHETDTPILDLVADIRAATPTDAGKRVVPDTADESRIIATGQQRLRTAIRRQVDLEQERLTQVRSRPVLRDPTGAITLQITKVEELHERLGRAVHHRLRREQDWLLTTQRQIRALSPQATLERGYAILTAGDGSGLTSIQQATPKDQISARLGDGALTATVRNVEPYPTKEDE
ncbi:MAG: exodeoxyribonuclease VII large subunit [Propioniciclava sp.]